MEGGISSDKEPQNKIAGALVPFFPTEILAEELGGRRGVIFWFLLCFVLF